MEIRKITDKERRVLNELYRYAYTEWSDELAKDEVLDAIVPNETFALFDGERLISSVRVHEFQQSIRGVLKECGGIAGVATYPEDRYKGYVRQLMQEAFKEMHKRGQSVSMLDPFKESFYAKFGYVKSNAPYIVKAPLEKLVHSIKEEPDTNWQIERFRAVEVKDEFLNFIKEVGPTKFHGFIIFKSISDAMWKQRVKDSIVGFVKYKGTIQAAVRYRIKGKEKGDEWVSDLTVIDLFWKTRLAREKLFNYLAKHKEQLDNIIIHAPFNPIVEHWFFDVKLKVRRGHTWMVRVIDVPKAVARLPAVGEDMVTIELSDPECSWNDGVFLIQSEKNQLQMNRSSGKPAVKASIKAFSSLVYGTLPVEELEFSGEIKFTESWARHTIQRWFPTRPLYNVVYF